MVWLEPSAGASITQPLMLYRDPLYILLLTLIDGPSQLAMRPVVSKLCEPVCAATVELVTLDEPERELQPSTPPSSNVVVMPVLSCWLGLGGGGANSPITTSLTSNESVGLLDWM